MKKLSKIEILGFIVISFTLVFFFWDNTVLAPIRFFATAIHESCHALATICTGGEVVEINLSGRQGHTLSRGGWPLVFIPAGYIGTSIIGAFLVVFSRNRKRSALLILILASVVLYLNFLYIDNYLSVSFWITNAIASALIFMVLKTNLNTHMSAFLGTFFAMASIEDARNYLFAIPYKTDAGIMARYIGIEFLALPIACIFFLFSAMIWWGSVKKIVK